MMNNAHTLWEKNKEIKNLISGWYYNNEKKWDPEYLLLYNKALELWIDKENIILEKEASNTKEMFFFQNE